ncbi:LysR family transcriptional regulator [Gordonia sp. FQ]|uniref:LysR family transcriptional regulator n=1 Tax=Gordonia sp. FQ TaxID=3446634 RepID=UPI003F873E91
MELRHLRYFRAVAEELHFGRAARRLHIAQPPLSQQIRQLEDELGVALLVRSTRRVELTPAGEDYLRRVIEILDGVDAAGRHARRIADGASGHLTIGCVGSATYSLLPRLVRSLREELPGVDVDLRGEMLVPALVDGLRSGALHFAVLRPPADAADLTVEVLRAEPLIVAVPEGHRLAERGSVDLAELAEDDFVVHAGQGRSVLNELAVSLCVAAGFTPFIRHEVAETSTLVTFVAAGLGVALVPEPTAALDIAGVRYLRLGHGGGQLDLAAAYLTSAHSPLIDRVLGLLRTAVGD